MRIGVISDTHISGRAAGLPDAIVKEFRKVDMVIHAGDLVDLAVLEQLKSVCPNVKAVRGNMDSEEVKKILPQKEILKIGNYKVGIMHGYGAPGNLMNILSSAFKDDGADLIIFGHSHCAANEKKEGTLFFNPGSPTDKVFSSYNSYGIIEINDKIEAKIIKI